MRDMNSVNLVGRLTKDPELRGLPSGSSVCNMRLAFSTSWKNGATGEWEDRPNYVDVTVWGAQGENCARHLAKGRQIAVQGKLEWREWETQEGQKRQALQVGAEMVQFLGGRGDGDGTGGGGSRSAAGAGAGSGGGSAGDDFDSVPVSDADEDIPFLWEGAMSYGRVKVHGNR